MIDIKEGDKIKAWGYVYPSDQIPLYALFADPKIGIVKSIEKMPYPDYEYRKNVIWFEQNGRLFFCHIKQCEIIND